MPTTTRVTQLMSRPPVTCDVGDTLHVAAGLMWQHDCGVIPVTSEGQLTGIITDRDICMASFMRGRPLGEILVADVMATEVVACHGDDGVDAAEKLMSERQIRRLPVIDQDDRPIGVLSLNDIARDAASSREGDGSRRGLVQTLGAISQPRRQVAE